MRHKKWECTKCKDLDFTVGEMRVAGGFWSKIFDVQGSKYSAVTCDNCRYTEFYKGSTSGLGNVFDFFSS
ncbi:MAG: GTP-binding protein [Gammaproteobacteria bacterium]|jgi:predicted nucleic-acid-binding Zn-ribbon protein|nr:GTP-binding protein [Gammaproteobacteria bacterium]MBT6043892.1 GTP-binding protein [Gammaproteobacteria bacterium]